MKYMTEFSPGGMLRRAKHAGPSGTGGLQLITSDETKRTDVPSLPPGAMRNTLLGIPLLLLVAAGYLYAFRLFEVTPDWRLIGFGALGWIIALALRAPAIALSSKLDREKGTLLVVSASGPAEELVRVMAVLLLGRSFPAALAIGFGWGAVEILFGIVNGLVAVTALQKDDEKSRQARELLARQGTLQNFGLSPLYGAWERIFATGLHVGFTLLLAAVPWAVFGAIPVHSLVNLSTIKFRGRLVTIELIVTTVGTAAMLLGLLAHGRL